MHNRLPTTNDLANIHLSFIKRIILHCYILKFCFFFQILRITSTMLPSISIVGILLQTFIPGNFYKYACCPLDIIRKVLL